MGETIDFRAPAQKRPLIRAVQGQVIADEGAQIDAIARSLKPTLTLHGGYETAEQFEVLDSVLATRGAKFWRFDKGMDLIPYPDTDTFRLDQLTSAYNRIPGLNKEQKELRNRWKKRPSLKAITDLMIRDVKVNDDIGVRPAIELFDNPNVNYHFMANMEYEGYIPYVVIKAFERWRVHHTIESETHPRVSEEDLNRGYRAFELFLFGTGKTTLLRKLSEVAKVYYAED